MTSGSALWRGAGVFVVVFAAVLSGKAAWHMSLRETDPLSAPGIGVVLTVGWALSDRSRRRVRT